MSKLVSIIDWIKRNKLTSLLSVVVLLLGYLFLTSNIDLKQTALEKDLGITPSQIVSPSNFDRSSLPVGQPANGGLQPDASDQVIIQESFISLQVKDVRGTTDRIISYAKDKDGIFVSSSFNQPEESPFATVSVLVPTDSLDGSLAYFRSLGVKVVSENLQGTDVTDEFSDIESRLALLQKTRSKLENLLDNATRVEDILNVQRELDNVLLQIESLQNQKKQIEKGANLTKITLYLATDELALPYVPDKYFRPALIFKQAVRNLVNLGRDLASLGIWLGVYAVVWLPMLLILIWLAKRKKV